MSWDFATLSASLRFLIFLYQSKLKRVATEKAFLIPKSPFVDRLSAETFSICTALETPKWQRGDSKAIGHRRPYLQGSVWI